MTPCATTASARNRASNGSASDFGGWNRRWHGRRTRALQAPSVDARTAAREARRAPGDMGAPVPGAPRALKPGTRDQDGARMKARPARRRQAYVRPSAP